MKSVIPVFLLTIATTSYAQVGKIYTLNQDQYLTPVSLSTGQNIPLANQVNPLDGFKFKVVKSIGTDYIIKFLKWKNNPTNDNDFYRPAGTNQQLYFKIPMSDFAEVADRKIPKYSFTVGTMTLPVKMRFGSHDTVEINPQIKKKRDFTFSSDVNLGLVVGGRFNISESFKITFPLVGFSVASIAANSETTNGYLSTSANLAAVSPYTGIVFQIDAVQIGIITGIDFISGRAGYNWDYRNQPWLGVGLGYSIFTTTATATKQ